MIVDWLGKPMIVDLSSKLIDVLSTWIIVDWFDKPMIVLLRR